MRGDERDQDGMFSYISLDSVCLRIIHCGRSNSDGLQGRTR